MSFDDYYCGNIQYLAKLNAKEAEKFTSVYCDVNDCGSCPFHSNKVVVREKQSKAVSE